MAIALLLGCKNNSSQKDLVYIFGTTPNNVDFITISKDTIKVNNGSFSDTLSRHTDQYNYIKLNTWKWPKIIYLELGQDFNLEFNKNRTGSHRNKVNEYLLNKDSILHPYSARWDMTDEDFRLSWQNEFDSNLNKIDSFFVGSEISKEVVDELKQMEYMMRGLRTANFISFKKRKGININRDIYDFVKNIDMDNERLAFNSINKNFQYFYILDKVKLPKSDPNYAFAAVDTINTYCSIKEIRAMILGSVIKSGLQNEASNHDALFKLYEKEIGTVDEDDPIVKIYNQIQKLKVGKPALEFGTLESFSGDQVSLKDFEGINILLSAWGTWCPFCKEELPHLKRLIDLYPDNFESVAISLDDDKEKWRTYVDTTQWYGTHLNDPKRQSTFRKNYLISGTNIYYLIDKTGVIRSTKLKPSDKALEDLIKGLDK